MSFPLEAQGRRRGVIHGPKDVAKSQTSGRQSSGRTKRDRETDDVEEGEEGPIDERIIDRNNRFLERNRGKGHKGLFFTDEGCPTKKKIGEYRIERSKRFGYKKISVSQRRVTAIQL